MYQIIIFGIPVLLAVLIFEWINVQMFIYSKATIFYSYAILRFAHFVPAYLFAYVSDKNYRKEALLASHIFGLSAVCILYFFGFNFWTLLFTALVFNPISVTRASLLDNFPQYSPLKLMAIPFIIKAIPWIVFGWLSVPEIKSNTTATLNIILFSINILFIYFLFKDKKDIFSHSHETHTSDYFYGMGKKIVYTIFAFILAETTIRTILGSVRFDNTHPESWITLSNIGLLTGYASAMLYKRLPHTSVVTLAYVVGACMMMVALVEQSFSIFGHKATYANIMTYYCVVGGLYHPFVADALITMFGSRKRALGAAMIDLSEAVSLIIGAFILKLITPSYYQTTIICLLLFLGASIFQRIVERHHLYRK